MSKETAVANVILAFASRSSLSLDDIMALQKHSDRGDWVHRDRTWLWELFAAHVPVAELTERQLAAARRVFPEKFMEGDNADRA